jgi:hypothetical protein
MVVKEASVILPRRDYSANKKGLNHLCQPINNQKYLRKSQPKSIDSKKEQNKNQWWQ